ncbi:lipoxygenase family protein [Pseudobacteriovorax antillogorgiicola]|uniref:Arachidonate 15-lipoxygenase n=1 Tax=Pseudobacteriovorax antillogorgiicola TaxID=1513793 RepID=A0A1Y6CQJ6_9BACT|nr:lipoxygenase family protein [Pseudobacteriovorax antillogorgiicola]TCS45898.1 arachidonate 15-lipoxygenase [Pseudobacteriovorax antillogorgiicola]SMF71137.1 arachidonate 15-lipoxygenase [Pseudobacteriovorax antillogorgiicola]
MTKTGLPCLPQHDANPEARDQELEFLRDNIDYDYSVLTEVPIASQILPQVAAGPLWGQKIVQTSYMIRRNWELNVQNNDFVFERPLPVLTPQQIGEILARGDLFTFIGYTNPDLGVALKDKRPTSYEDYKKLFQQIPFPEGADKLDDDKEFADHFVAGLNPVLIERLKRLPGHYGLTSAMVRSHPKFKFDSLKRLLKQGRLFAVDYKDLAILQPGVHPDQDKFTYSPIVFLARPRWSGNLEVIAIQCDQNPNEAVIATPKSQKWTWLSAKTIAKIADINHHELVSHLGLTHLLIDPIIVATMRQLSSSHPLYKLLIPHFEGTLPINSLAVKTLLAKGGSIEQLLAGERDSAFALIGSKRTSFKFRENFLPRSLWRRGVGFGSGLRHYPYRDDGLLVWAAIQKWVRDYVNLYYEDNSDVRDDYELARWTAEIVDDAQGRIKDFAPHNEISSKRVLVETLTMILFTCSAQHAAVNFPQAKASAPSFQPLAGYAPAPKDESTTEDEAVAILPPLDRALKQVHILTLLGRTYYTQLGHYAEGTFEDTRVADKLASFQQKLAKIEEIIMKRNGYRRTKYEHLMPSRIPQSINI